MINIVNYTNSIVSLAKSIQPCLVCTELLRSFLLYTQVLCRFLYDKKEVVLIVRCQIMLQIDGDAIDAPSISQHLLHNRLAKEIVI